MSDERHSPRIGYVLKMYPRFSETFVVTEILALEREGADLDVFSLRAPADGRFHEAVSRVRAPVTYVATPTRAGDLWDALAACRLHHRPGVDAHLDELLAAPPADAHQALLLAVAARERGITHLHAHFGSVATAVARLAARVAGITYSFTLHAKDIFHHDVDRAALTERLRDAAFAVTVSDYNERFLRDRHGDAASSVVRVYNGIDLEAFPLTSPLDRPRAVVGVGRLVEKKGFDHLVDAVALLHRQGRGVRLDLVGEGAEEDALRARAADLGIAEHVVFHGALTQDEARAVVRGAAVLAAPCVVAPDGNRDGLPTVVLESLALGTPVVTTPVTGIPEAVRHGRTGLLVPESDAPALAEAIATLVDDPLLRCELAVAGRRHVEEHFDAATNGRLLHERLVALARGRREVTV